MKFFISRFQTFFGISTWDPRYRGFSVIFHTLTQKQNKTDMKQLVTVNIAHAYITCTTIIAPQIDTDGLNPLHHQCLLSYIYIVCVQLHTLLIVLERRLELEEKSNKSQNKCISNAFLKYVAIIQDYVHLYNSNRVKNQNLTLH